MIWWKIIFYGFWILVAIELGIVINKWELKEKREPENPLIRLIAIALTISAIIAAVKIF